MSDFLTHFSDRPKMMTLNILFVVSLLYLIIIVLFFFFFFYFFALSIPFVSFYTSSTLFIQKGNRKYTQFNFKTITVTAHFDSQLYNSYTQLSQTFSTCSCIFIIVKTTKTLSVMSK